MGAAGWEQARDGALLALARNRGDSTGEKRLITFHVAAKPRVLVEARAGLCIGKIAPDGGFLEPVEHLLGLRVGQQDFALVANMDDEIGARSEEHTSELQSLMRISYAVFCLKKKNTRPLQQSYQHIRSEN